MNTFLSKVRYIWQNAENLLIILFLATFTLNIRKVFLTPYSFLNDAFNEYMTPSFSWADLLMIAVIIIYTIKLLFSQFIEPAINNSLPNNVIRNKSSVILRITELLRPHIIVSRETIVLMLLLTWIGFSIFWSQYKPLAIYRFFTFVEIALFAAVSLRILKNQKWLKMAFLALIFNGLFQSILGIAQFVRNKSLGVRWLGESILGPNVDGVAKVILEGERHIRAYGTFPHPNILAGFLIIPLFVLADRIACARFPLLHKKGAGGRSDTPHQNSNPTLPLPRGEKTNKVSRGTFLNITPAWILSIAFVIIFAGFLLTFSRSAFLGLAVAFLVLFLKYRKVFNRKFHFSSVFFAFFALLSIFVGGYLIYQKDLVSIFSTQSLAERNFYQNVARETISTNTMTGVGVGQFVIKEYEKYSNLPGWQYQPVHNIYLLVFSELGIMGLIFFLLWIFSILGWGSKRKRNTNLLLTVYIFYCIILSFLFIAFFDHYFWDIKLGVIIFVLPVLLLKILNNKTVVG